MAAAMRIGVGSPPSSSSVLMRRNLKNNQKRYCANQASFISASATTVSDAYKILRIRRDASESEVKKAFRNLALKYHPDVCKAENSAAKFNKIYEAYDAVMTNLKEEPKVEETESFYEPWEVEEEEEEEEERGEWMGWEAAWPPHLHTTYYSPYIY